MLSFKNDFYELKYRIFYVLFSFISSLIVCYSYRSQVIFIFSKPLIALTGFGSKTSFIYTHLGEAFLAQLQSCIILSFLVGFVPIFCLNLWFYIVPGLFLFERRNLNNFALLFLLFIIIGFFIGYNLLIPLAWKFLIGFSIQDNSPFNVLLEARIKDYIDLIFNLVCLVLLVFQIPFLTVISLLLGFTTLDFCIKHRRYFLLFSWVIAACVTPPDILSQALVAIPLYAFIELTFLVCFCLGFRQK